jgi:hypothetical protein
MRRTAAAALLPDVDAGGIGCKVLVVRVAPDPLAFALSKIQPIQRLSMPTAARSALRASTRQPNRITLVLGERTVIGAREV